VKMIKGLVAALLCWGACLGAQAQQAPLFEEIRTVSSVATPVQSAEFTVATAGPHDITLTDLGASLAPAAPVASIQLAVMRGATIAATLTAAGTTQVNLPAGTYIIRVAGQPGPNAGSGLFSVSVRAMGAAQPLFSFNDALSEIPPLVPSHVRLIQDGVTLPAGDYVAELVDLAFPQALTFSSVIVTSGASEVALLNLPASPGDHAAFTAGSSGGTFSIFALGDSPAATNAGLFMIRVRDTNTNTIKFARLLSVGRVTSLGSKSGMTVGSYTLVAADLAFPAALTQSGALVANASNVAQPVEAARLGAPGSLAFNVANAGTYEVFGLAVPGTTPGGGAQAVEIHQASSTVFSAVQTAGGDVASGTPVFAFPIDIVNAGSYTATVTDMQFPAVLAAVSLALSQGAVVVQRADVPGSINGSLVAGRSYVLVAAKPASGSGTLQQSGGLFGIQMAPTDPGTGSPLLQTTQGVGGVFSARRFVIPSTADYRFTLDDVGFPAPFTELAAAVTRGTERLGLIYGEGSFDVLQATPGDYVVNFIVRPDVTLKSGTYYLSAGIKPPLPTVTLSSSPVSPALGGTVMFTWSTQNAASCVASNAWTGSRPVSGTEQSPAINASSTFALTCTGTGGSATASLTVTPASAQDPNSSGGGGALGLLGLLGLGGMMLRKGRIGRA
jgi:hypothetical protein